MYNNNFSKSWLDNKDIKSLKIKGGLIDPFAANKILNAVSKVVNIVHNNNNYTVKFRKADESYTNYEDKTIVITTKFLDFLDKMSLYDIIDLETGLALHESAHAEYTFTTEGKIKMKSIRNNIKHHLHNIIEDVFIEEIISKDFPGFEGYFIKLRKHYFEESSVKKSGNLLSDRINEFLIGLRYCGTPIISDNKVKEALSYVNKKLINDVEELINTDRFDMAENVYTILTSDIKNDNKKPNQNNASNENSEGSNQGGISISIEIDSQSAGDNSSNSNDVIISSDNDKLDKNDSSSNNNGSGVSIIINNTDELDMSDNEIGGALKDFLEKVLSENKAGLTDSENELLKCVSEESTEGKEYDINSKDIRTKIKVYKSKTSDNKKQKYKVMLNEMRPLILNFRNKFSDANTIFRQNSYGLSSGMLDDDSLYSAKFNRNLFYNNNVEKLCRTKNVDIAFVIDCSGSMSARLTNFNNSNIRRLGAAQMLATLFVEALDPIRSVNTWVYGFQSSVNYLGNKMNELNKHVDMDAAYDNFNLSTQMICCYEPGMKTKSRIATLKQGGYTPEYDSLHFMTEEILKKGRKDAKKIIVMLTDGEPYKPGISDNEHNELIKLKDTECKKKGITLIHLALTKEAKRTPYKNKINWDEDLGFKGLSDAFIKMLKKEIS